MAKYVLAINKDKDFLRDRSDEIVLNAFEKPRVVRLVNELKDTLKANKNLVALALPQLGKKERMFAIKFSSGDIKVFINPAIVRTEGMHLSREISIGLDDTEYIIPRSNEIYATYQTPDMTDNCDMNKFSGAVAEVFQQMNDLLNGVLLEDMGLEVIKGWDKASEEEREEIIAMYLDSLKTRQESIQKAIDENPDAKNMSKAIEFMTKLQLGEIETMPLTDAEKEEIRKNTAKSEEDK